ncbi:MAG: hypothetical protein JOZ77_12480 [Candidatus Eremiobacteraeota bacterium]|nr:hypothetical protein [Candidatus Eremiobacteraeota bacterium]
MSTTDFSSYVTEQIESRSADSGRRIRTTAQTIRTVADQLRNDPTTAMAADFAERGADVVDRVGSYIEGTPLKQMVADAEQFSRQQPLAVVGAGLAVGILASRLLKSTAARRDMWSSEETTNTP